MPSKSSKRANNSKVSYRDLSKEELIAICEEKDAEIATLQVSLQELTSRLEAVEKKLESPVENTSVFSQRIEKLERDNYRNQQYSRRETVELVGIPDDISDQPELEEKVVEIFKYAGVDVNCRSFHAIHRLKNKAVVIAKCTNRRDATAILRAKKRLRELDHSSRAKLGITGKLYVNESLYPEYKRLFGICNTLYKSKKIHSSYTINGTIKIIEKEGGTSKAVEHINDLNNFFGEGTIKSLIIDHQNKIKRK